MSWIEKVNLLSRLRDIKFNPFGVEKELKKGDLESFFNVILMSFGEKTRISRICTMMQK
jgi:hypothetical protein